MDEIDRIKLLFGMVTESRKAILESAGIDYRRFSQVLARNVELRASELTAIANLYPEYRYWLAYGEELPEAGQISPMTKAAQQSLGTQRKA